MLFLMHKQFNQHNTICKHIWFYMHAKRQTIGFIQYNRGPYSVSLFKRVLDPDLEVSVNVSRALERTLNINEHLKSVVKTFIIEQVKCIQTLPTLRRRAGLDPKTTNFPFSPR